MTTSGEIQIEKGVPMPENRGKHRLYPLDRMEPGDSFLVGRDKLESLRNAAIAYSKRHKTKFSCRVINAEQARCWRIK